MHYSVLKKHGTKALVPYRGIALPGLVYLGRETSQ